MITSTNNFTALFRASGRYANKGYIIRKIPGYNVFLLNKQLDTVDNRDYHVLPTADGSYLAFLGREWTEQATSDFADRYTVHQVDTARVTKRKSGFIPTWEQSAKNWLDHESIPYNVTGRYHNVTPRQIFGSTWKDGKSWQAGNWTVLFAQSTDSRLQRDDLPWQIDGNGTILFVHNNKVMSERERRMINIDLAKDTELSLSTALWLNDETTARECYERLIGVLHRDNDIEYYAWNETKAGISVFDILRGNHCTKDACSILYIVSNMLAKED